MKNSERANLPWWSAVVQIGSHEIGLFDQMVMAERSKAVLGGFRLWSNLKKLPIPRWNLGMHTINLSHDRIASLMSHDASKSIRTSNAWEQMSSASFLYSSLYKMSSADKRTVSTWRISEDWKNADACQSSMIRPAVSRLSAPFRIHWGQIQASVNKFIL